MTDLPLSPFQPEAPRSDAPADTFHEGITEQRANELEAALEGLVLGDWPGYEAVESALEHVAPQQSVMTESAAIESAAAEQLSADADTMETLPVKSLTLQFLDRQARLRLYLEVGLHPRWRQEARTRPWNDIDRITGHGEETDVFTGCVIADASGGTFAMDYLFSSQEFEPVGTGSSSFQAESVENAIPIPEAVYEAVQSVLSPNSAASTSEPPTTNLKASGPSVAMLPQQYPIEEMDLLRWMAQPAAPKKRRGFSPESRARMSQAKRQWWAERKASSNRANGLPGQRP